jgi:hypothetical protein
MMKTIGKLPNQKISETDMMVYDIKEMKPFAEDQRNTHAQGGTRAVDSDDENDDNAFDVRTICP